MIRTLLALMAGLLCTLAGMKHAAHLKGDAARLARWVQLLKQLALLLNEGVLSIPEALCATAEGSGLPDRMLRETAMKMGSAPALSIEAAFSQCCESLPESSVLSRMFSRLGRGSKQSRILAVEQTTEELQLMAANASSRAEKDVRLWQTLGLIGGACLTMMLL